MSVTEVGVEDNRWRNRLLSSPLWLLALLPKVYSGAHLAHPAVEMLRGRRVRLEARTIAYADGERLGALPVTCENTPGALRVVGAALRRVEP